MIIMIKQKFLLVFSTLIVSFAARSQDLGVAYFAMQSPKFPCKEAMTVFDDGLPLSTAVLWGTFGTETACLDTFLRLHPSQPRVLEIHFSNEACRRNNRCAGTDYLPQLSVVKYNEVLESKDTATIDSIRERVKQIRGFVKAYENARTEFILSTGLEDNFTEAAFVEILAAVRSEWPHRIVRSPVGTLKRPSFTGADYIEQHGSRPRFPKKARCLANLDGTDLSFPHRPSDQKNRIEWNTFNEYVNEFGPRCRLTFAWAAPWQGIFGANFVQPADRNFLIDPKDVAELRELRKKYYERLSS